VSLSEGGDPTLNSTVTKNVKVKAEKGIYTFSDFMLTSYPESVVSLNFTSDAIDEEMMIYLNLVNFTYCKELLK
jgi:hypothetical protein